jgi:hypothetical protein
MDHPVCRIRDSSLSDWGFSEVYTRRVNVTNYSLVESRYNTVEVTHLGFLSDTFFKFFSSTVNIFISIFMTKILQQLNF